MATAEHMKRRIARLIAEGKCVQCAEPKTNPERRCKPCLEIDRGAQKMRYLLKPLKRKIVLDIHVPRRMAVAGEMPTAEELERIRNTPMSHFTVDSCRPE